MARLNLAKQFGVLTDDGGSRLITTPEIIDLVDDDIDSQAFQIAAASMPACYAGNWSGGAYEINADAMCGRTFIYRRGVGNQCQFTVDGAVRQVGFYGKNVGSEVGYFKVKAFRDDGYGSYNFVGETEYFEVPIESDSRIHEYFVTSPFNVLQNDYLAWYFISNGSTIYMKSSGSSGTIPGEFVTGDVTWAVQSADFSSSVYAVFTPTSLRVTDSAYSNAILHIDLVENYKCSRLEVFTDKYTEKDLVKIYSSIDNSEWLEWSDHKYYSRWDSVTDGNNTVEFNGTRGVVYANIDGAPRYYKIDFRASCFSGRSIHEVVVLNDEQYVDFKPSDFDLTAGNWIGSRSATLALSARTRVDLTEPCNKDGYIYGFQFYGRSEVAQKLTFYVLRDKGTVLEVVDTTQTVDNVEVAAQNTTYTVTLETPLKVKTGDYIAIKGLTNVYLMYDANATATTPINDPDNNGNGSISGGVTTTNSTTKTETWTLECVDDSVPGQSIWNVTGSVSGLQASQAYAGIEYTSTNSEVQFTINNGGSAFAVGDMIYFETVEQGEHWHIADAEITGTVGQYITKTDFTQTNLYNLALKIYQDIWTDEVWCDDAEIGTPGGSETIRVYNQSSSTAEAWFDIVDYGDEDLIQVSNDNSNWYSYGDAGLPLRIKNRSNPASYEIAASDYGNIYVRTNLSSGIDTRRNARIYVRFVVTT